MAQLTGAHGYQLDPKGRLSLPRTYRDAFSDGCVLAPGRDMCLTGFPRAEWEKFAEKLALTPYSSTAEHNFARFVLGRAQVCQLDGQGRLTIPNDLRDRMQIGTQIVILGLLTYIEVWDKARHEAFEDQHMDEFAAGEMLTPLRDRI